MSLTTPAPAPTREIEQCGTLRDEIRRVVAVPDSVLEPILVAFLAGGHVLVEGIPGTGKTLLTRALARTLDCDFNRIQFTNDLMPSDIIGSSVWRPGKEAFEFIKGPLFSNVVLADEVNRTSSRTLSCLLEAMEEGVVSVEGKPVQLADPFIILATRNPIEFHGTFPVPEAALDRFLVRVELGYPDEESERNLYRGVAAEKRLADLQPILTRGELMALMAAVDNIAVSAALSEYAFRVVDATRNDEAVALGVSPRAAISWIRAGRARALLDGRTYALPDDLKVLAPIVLGHRVFLKGGGDARELIEQIVSTTPVQL